MDTGAGILQIRLYALYSLNKRVLALMLTCYFAALATSAWIMANALAQFTGAPQIKYLPQTLTREPLL